MIQQKIRQYIYTRIGVCRFRVLSPGRPLLVVVMVLAAAMLACNLTGGSAQPSPERIVRYKLLPPVTPTANAVAPIVAQVESEPASPVIQAATAVAVVTAVPPTLPPESAQPTAEPTNSPTFTPAPTPTAPPTIEPTFTPTPVSEWSFANIRIDTDQYEDDLLFYGNVINNSDSSKILAFITGVFYDDQNQVVADEQDTYDYWLVDVIPPKGQIPFELTVANVKNIANFDFLVEAELGGESKSSAFEFVNVQVENDGDYCLEGLVKNVGRDVDDYVTVVAVIYDDQDSMISFADDEFDAGSFNNGDEEEFFVCVDTLGYHVARHELQAWGE